MGRPARLKLTGQKPTVDLKVTLTHEAKAKIEDLRVRSGSLDNRDLIIRALATFDLLISCGDDGNKIFIRSPDGEEKEVVLTKEEVVVH